MRFLIVILLACVFGWYAPKVFSQTQTTNIVSGNWNGATIVTDPSQLGCCSGGPQPAYTTNDGTLHFSYGGYSAWQIYAINQALSGTGVQIKGYNYSWNVLNTGEASGNLQAWIWLTNPTGVLHEYYWYDLSADTQGTWKNYSGTQNFTQNYLLSNVGQLGIQFYGNDNRYWAGYYGPKVKDINVTLNYTVDQCTTNPQSSPTCPGYITPTTTTTTTLNSTIQSVITPVTTTAVTALNPAAPVQLIQQNTLQGVQNVNLQTNTQTQSSTQKNESSTTTSNSNQQSKEGNNTKQNSTTRAKEEMKKAEGAKSMEEQVATQGAVVAAIGFVPGFDSYQGLKLVDVNGLQLQRQYGKDVIDNRRIGRRMFGATDSMHQQMIEQQYR